MAISCLATFLCVKKNWMGIFSSFFDKIILYWYVIVLAITTIFVIFNYESCINLHFTENFNGKNLIFLFWLAIIVFPFFDSFEGFGISLKKRKEEKTIDNRQRQYYQDLTKEENDGIEEGGNDE